MNSLFICLHWPSRDHLDDIGTFRWNCTHTHNHSYHIRVHWPKFDFLITVKGWHYNTPINIIPMALYAILKYTVRSRWWSNYKRHRVGRVLHNDRSISLKSADVMKCLLYTRTYCTTRCMKCCFIFLTCWSCCRGPFMFAWWGMGRCWSILLSTFPPVF